METFDSTKTSLYDILKDIHKGKIQLPDFQRGWVWDDDRIKGIIASVAKSFPIGPTFPRRSSLTCAPRE